MNKAKRIFSRKKIIGVAVILVLLIGVGVYAASLLGYSPFAKRTTGSTWKPLTITQENVASVMSRTNLVKDIPDDGLIALYIGDESYTLTHASMRSGGSSDADVTIRIPESYLVTLGQYGPCSAIARAHQNGEIGVQLGKSSTALAWKYKSLAKYRTCLR